MPSAIGILAVATSLVRLCFVRQPKAGQRHSGEADAEFLQRRAPRDGLGQVLCEFIECVAHIFPFVSGCLFSRIAIGDGEAYESRVRHWRGQP